MRSFVTIVSTFALALSWPTGAPCGELTPRHAPSQGLSRQYTLSLSLPDDEPILPNRQYEVFINPMPKGFALSSSAGSFHVFGTCQKTCGNFVSHAFPDCFGGRILWTAPSNGGSVVFVYTIVESFSRYHAGFIQEIFVRPPERFEPARHFEQRNSNRECVDELGDYCHKTPDACRNFKFECARHCGQC